MENNILSQKEINHITKYWRMKDSLLMKLHLLNNTFTEYSYSYDYSSRCHYDKDKIYKNCVEYDDEDDHILNIGIDDNHEKCNLFRKQLESHIQYIDEEYDLYLDKKNLLLIKRYNDENLFEFVIHGKKYIDK